MTDRRTESSPGRRAWAFVKRHWTWAIVLAAAFYVYRHYSGEAIPRTYLIDRQGRIRYAHEGLLLKGALRDALATLVAEQVSDDAPVGSQVDR